MLTDLAFIGGIVVAVIGLVELSGSRDRRPRGLTPEGAIRGALEGPEAASVRAEFGRRGVIPPESRRLPLPFGR